MLPRRDLPAVPARLERAQRVIAEGRVSQTPYEPVGYEVVSSDGLRTYLVQLEGQSPCNCPDALYRRRHCKHYFAAALVHMGALAMREERQARNGSTVLQRATPRRGHPIWYKAAPGQCPAGTVETHPTCADCGFEMPPTDPCPSCQRLVCDRCFDPITGACLACPIEGGF